MCFAWIFRINIPTIKEQKEGFLWFESAKMHCEFPDITNAFQMRFDELSNSKGNKGDRIKTLNIGRKSLYNSHAYLK